MLSENKNEKHFEYYEHYVWKHGFQDYAVDGNLELACIKSILSSMNVHEYMHVKIVLVIFNTNSVQFSIEMP